MTYDAVIEALYDLADCQKIAEREKKFGIISQNALGITHRDLNLIAKEIGKDDDLAHRLFDSGIYEGKLLCAKIHRPKSVTDALCEQWVKVFDNWEICDAFCMGQIGRSLLAVKKINEWAFRTAEFEKRAAFATLAALCMADKKAENEVFEAFFPLLKSAASDERLYVKKAVSWALRGIGKRNPDLREHAVELAEELEERPERSAVWIAKDVLRELTANQVRSADYPRSIYRP